MTFGLSPASYDVILFVVLLHYFICVVDIQKGKVDSISRRYQIIIDNILKNYSRRYSNYCIIKFIVFMPIDYTINLDIILFFYDF